MTPLNEPDRNQFALPDDSAGATPDPTELSHQDADLEFLQRVMRVQDGAADDRELRALEEELASDQRKWRLFTEIQLQSAAINDHLRGAAYVADAERNHQIVQRKRPAWRYWFAAATCSFALSVAAFFKFWPTVVAEFNAVGDARWAESLKSPPQPSTRLVAGQCVALAGGQVGITFGSGASIVLTGPADFQVLSENSGFLRFGSLSATAATQSSKGFTIKTDSAHVVDLGTEFRVQANSFGDSQVSVTSGQVHVHPSSAGQLCDLRAGHSLSLANGASKIMTRIEQGDGTDAFRFPTIEPPTANDYADQSQGAAGIRLLQGKVDNSPNDIWNLNDGAAQSYDDSAFESFYLAKSYTASGFVTFDLHRSMKVKKINAYSWHVSFLDASDSARAVQKFILYGSNGDLSPEVSDLQDWTVIASINSDSYFSSMAEQRPAQVASSISAPEGYVGEFRYLIWEISCDIRQCSGAIVPHTFFGEIDVYAE